ncbi:MAG: hypothetical protein R3F14_20655, partial [Polyangiaceae bacterium]
MRRKDRAFRARGRIADPGGDQRLDLADDLATIVQIGNLVEAVEEEDGGTLAEMVLEERPESALGH